MRTLSDRFRWWAKRAPDTVLDFVYGVDTGPEIAGERGPYAYDAAPWWTLIRAMRLASLRAEGFSFVDIGCGKARCDPIPATASSIQIKHHSIAYTLRPASSRRAHG